MVFGMRSPTVRFIVLSLAVPAEAVLFQPGATECAAGGHPAPPDRVFPEKTDGSPVQWLQWKWIPVTENRSPRACGLSPCRAGSSGVPYTTRNDSRPWD